MSITYYHKFGQNIKIFKMLCTKYMYMASCEAMTSSTRSFAKFQSVITSSSYFSTKFHQVYTVLFEKCLLFLLKLS